MRTTTLTLALLSMLLCLPAAAAPEGRRSVLLVDGRVHVGWIVERADDYLLLRGEDGVVREIPRAQVSEIVLVDPSPPSARPPWVGAADDGSRAPPRERYEAGGDPGWQRRWEEEQDPEPDGGGHRADDWERKELDSLNSDLVLSEAEAAKLGHKLAIGPMIPTMIAGFALSAAGGASGRPALAVGAGAVSWAGVSVGIGGASLAYRSSGRPPRGLAFLIVGASVSLTGHGLYNGFMIAWSTRQVDMRPGASFAYMGLGLGLTGNILLAVSAKISRTDGGMYGYESRAPKALPFVLADRGGVRVGAAGLW